MLQSTLTPKTTLMRRSVRRELLSFVSCGDFKSFLTRNATRNAIKSATDFRAQLTSSRLIGTSTIRAAPEAPNLPRLPSPPKLSAGFSACSASIAVSRLIAGTRRACTAKHRRSQSDQCAKTFKTPRSSCTDGRIKGLNELFLLHPPQTWKAVTRAMQGRIVPPKGRRALNCPVSIEFRCRQRPEAG